MAENLEKTSNPFKNPKPFSIGDIIGTPDLKNVSYTAFDFYAIKERTVEYIKKYFPDDFNDFTESDLGIMLVELWAYMADLISFKIDMNINEVFVDTVSQRKNIHRIAKLVGYRIRPPRPAVSRMSLSVPVPYNFDIKIIKGTSIVVPSRDGQLLNFELYSADENWNPITDEDIFIPAGSSTNLSVLAIEGSSTNMSKTSDGTRFQKMTSPNISVLDGSVEVFVNNQKWTEVEFFNEQNNGPYYRVEFDQDYRITVFFSDDVRGRVPPQGSQILVNYRFGGGSRGNVDIGFINQIINVTSDIVPASIPVDARNYTKAEGGEDAEPIDEIKRKLPLYTKAQDRAVTGEDYSIVAELFSTLYSGRIGKAKAVLRNSGCSGNIVDIYVLQFESSETLKTASSNLKHQLQTHVESKKMLTDFICIKDAAQVFQNININIGITKFYSSLRKDIFEQVQQAVNDFFSLNRWRIGQPLKKADLFQFLNNIPHVSSLNIEFVENNQNLTDSQDDVVVDYWKIIRPGQISINVSVTD